MAATTSSPTFFAATGPTWGPFESLYDANILLTGPNAPFTFYDPNRPIYTHPRFLPGSRLTDCTVRDSIIAEGCYIDQGTIERSVIGIRTSIQSGTTIRRSVLLGADYYATDDLAPAIAGPKLGIGHDVVLDGVIVDKNAHIGDGAQLTNAKQLENADGDGYYIRDGIIVVPKDGVVKAGTIV